MKYLDRLTQNQDWNVGKEEENKGEEEPESYSITECLREKRNAFYTKRKKEERERDWGGGWPGGGQEKKTTVDLYNFPERTLSF